MTVQNNKPDTKHEALQALKFTLFSISRSEPTRFFMKSFTGRRGWLIWSA